MGYKDIEAHRAAIRRHYYANKEVYIEKNRRRRSRIKTVVKVLKSSTPCADCGARYPAHVMDFDHLKDKKYEINLLVNGANMSRIRQEIAKCEIVCANCHRKRTYNRIKKSPR